MPKTPQGLGYVRWALALGAVMQGITLVGGAWLAYLAFEGGGFPGPSGGFFSLLFASSLLIVCASGIVGLIALIFFTLGFSTAHDGREEYGLEHAQEMDRALLYFIVAFVMGAIASFGGLGAGPGLFDGVSPLFAVTGAFGAVRGLFTGLLALSLVKMFASTEDRTFGLLGAILLAASPAAQGGLFLFGGGMPISIVLGAVAALAAVELVAYLLFFQIYVRVLRRMRAGEFPPLVRPPLMYTPYYPGPMYYPPYPAFPPPPGSPPPENPPP